MKHVNDEYLERYSKFYLCLANIYSETYKKKFTDITHEELQEVYKLIFDTLEFINKHLPNDVYDDFFSHESHEDLKKDLKKLKDFAAFKLKETDKKIFDKWKDDETLSDFLQRLKKDEPSKYKRKKSVLRFFLYINFGVGMLLLVSIVGFPLSLPFLGIAIGLQLKIDDHKEQHKKNMSAIVGIIEFSRKINKTVLSASEKGQTAEKASALNITKKEFLNDLVNCFHKAKGLFDQLPIPRKLRKEEPTLAFYARKDRYGNDPDYKQGMRRAPGEKEPDLSKQRPKK